MYLQVALDFVNGTQNAIKIADMVLESIDIIEVGTPLIMECGLSAVGELKDAYPEKQILADLKIADAGYQEAQAAFAAGADIVTVLAVTDDATIENTIRAAREHNGAVMVDMLAVADLPRRLAEIDRMGADYICLHTSKDLQRINNDAVKAFKTLRQYVKHAKLAIAGGIGETTIARYASIKPDIVIVGEGIVLADNPSATAKSIKSEMKKYKG